MPSVENLSKKDRNRLLLEADRLQQLQRNIIINSYNIIQKQQNACTDYRSTIEQLRATEADLIAESNELQSTIHEYDRSTERVINALDTMKESSIQAHEKYADEISRAVEKIKSLEEAIKAAEIDKANLQLELTMSNRHIDFLDFSQVSQKIHALECPDEALLDMVKTQKKPPSICMKLLDLLLDSEKSHREEIEVSSKAVNDLESIVEDLKDENASLKAQIEELSREKEILSNDLQSAKNAREDARRASPAILKSVATSSHIRKSKKNKHSKRA